MILSSLRLRLLVLFVFVAFMAVSVAEIFSHQITLDALQNYTGPNHTGKAQAFFGNSADMVVNTLLMMYYQHPDHQALETQVQHLANSSHLHIVLLDHRKRVLADALPPLYHSSTVFIVSTESTLPHQPSSTSPSPYQQVLVSVNASFWQALLLAFLVAVLFAWFCSQLVLTPLQSLIDGIQQVEQGDFSLRVQVRRKDELGHLARTFNDMAEKLEQTERIRRCLMSDIAHELRTPLTNILGYLDALQDQVITLTPEVLHILVEETLLLYRLVTDVRELSLAEAGQLRLERIPMAVEECIVKAVEALSPQMVKKELTLQMDLPSSAPLVEADPERMGQILRNLLSNAITHSPMGGRILVEMVSTMSMIKVRVHNTGEGIAQHHLPYLFERFYRVDSSRSRETGGTGLGLAIVKHLIQAQGGEVTVESHPGQGVCFTFTLPSVHDVSSGETALQRTHDSK